MESLCWTCARAYARPDPEGCGLHRVKNKLTYIQKAAFIEGVKVEDRKRPSHGAEETMQVIVVTKCSHYDREDRKTKAKELSFSTLMRHKYREGIV